MLANRLIPVLLIKNRKLIKTVKFKKNIYVGDPINAIKIFNEKEVDELIVLDITANKNKIGPDFQLISEIAKECFIPLTYGGGITSLNQVEQLFNLGIEKVSLNNIIYHNPYFLKELSEYFGSQSIVASIDIKKNWFGKYCLFDSKVKRLKHENINSLIQKIVKYGAGEILLNSVDMDGSLNGPDLEIIKKYSKDVSVPIIYLGGIKSLDDIKNSIESGANAVAAGSFFIFYGPHKAVLITYPKYNQLKKILN